MADSRARLKALKAVASTFPSRLQLASTQAEAVDIAIEAASSLMQAISLSSDPEEKKELKAQCNTIITVASEIKDTENWKPATPSTLTPDQGRNTNIVRPSSSTSGPSSSASEFALKSEIPSSQSSVESGVGEASGGSGLGRINGHDKLNGTIEQDEAGKDAEGGVGLDIADQRRFSGHDFDLHANHEKTMSNSSPDHGSAVGDKNSFAALAHQAPWLTPGSSKPETTVRRLVEPVSTRKLNKREKIIVLKASKVNGYKFPPWDKPPTSEDFKSENGSVFTDNRELALSTYQLQYFSGWKRAQEALPPPSLISSDINGNGPIMGASDTIDLVQDAATDCSVVASLCAAIARAERGHDDMLLNMISPYDKNLGKPVMSPNGKYIVRLNFNGCWRKVEIDDRLPVSKSHRLLHVIDRKNPALLWPALLEKAYLKIRGGYDFPGSNSCSDLWTFTGWIPEQIYLQETDTVPSQLWKRLYNAFLYGDVLVTVGTGKMSTKQERELGLEGQHSYVVLDMAEIHHDRLLLIKNPWVEGKGWKGPRPTAAPLVGISTSSNSASKGTDTYNIDSVPSKNRPHPTTFWISLDHVIQHFESLYLNWNPGLFRNRQDIHFEWHIDHEQDANGCIVDHPQFALHTQKGDVVWLLLQRHLRDNAGGPRDESDAFLDGSARPDSQIGSSGELLKGFMSIYVCNGNGQRLYVKKDCIESGPYVNTTQSLLRWESDASSTYTVVIDQDELPASKYTFSLSTFSNSILTLAPALQTYPHEKVMRGSWTTRTAGGSISSPRYFENPQFSLEVKTKCDVAILLTSKHTHPMHVKLTFGFGKRIYKLQSRDVIADSEEHRGGSVFAEARDVSAGLYTIVCSLFEADKMGDFELRVDSTMPVLLTEIPRDGAGLISIKLNAGLFGPQMHKIAAPMRVLRIASFTVIARFLRATTARAQEVGMMARSPLRLSFETGRGPARTFLMTSENGAYSDSAIVRSEAVTLDPAVQGSEIIYLVLDRLCGPGAPIEEWYDVEMFTDAQRACDIGVWREWDD